MYKVLLIDDEKIIRIALKSMIDWEKQGFTICGTAANSETALSIISEQHPDLLIVDIMMPKTDGITFINQIRSLDYEGQIIILSNHQNFGYAVEAIHNNVFDYILKTDISPDSLIDVLKKVKKVLDKTKPETIQKENIIINNDLELFHNIVNKVPLTNDTSEFSDSYLFLDVFLRTKVTRKKMLTNIPQSTLKNLIQEIPGISGYFILQLSEDSVLIIVPEQKWINFTSNLDDLRSKIENLVKLYMNTDCGFVCSNIFHTVEEFSTKLSYLHQLEQLVLYHGFQYVISDMKHEEYTNENINFSAMIRSIKQAMSSDNFEECKEIISLELDNLKESKTSISTTLQMLPQLYTFIIFDNSIYLERSKEQLQKIAGSYQQCCTLDEYLSLLYELVDLISNSKTSFYTSSFRNEIKIIDAFIQDNIDKKISLTMLAKHLNRSENYLSRLFKSETGINTVTYINNKKMHRAKEFLANSQLSIKEIASSLGFDEPSYFNRIFNKIYGMNPTDYRKMLNNSSYNDIQETE